MFTDHHGNRRVNHPTGEPGHTRRVSDEPSPPGKAGPPGIEAQGPDLARAVGKSPALTPEQGQLVLANIGLVGVHLRTRVPTPRQPTRQREYEDLFQEGCVALIRAAMSYDPGTDGAFAAYALPRIRGVIHAAIHEHFATIRVPTEVLKSRPPAGLGGRPWDLHSVLELTPVLARALEAPPPAAAAQDSVRHLVRCRFERAVRLALTEVGRRTWRRRDPVPIMSRIATERLLISSERERTPLRRIAREAGISSGRASAYEQQLVDTVRQHLAADPQLPVLIRIASGDADGLDALVDPHQQEQLAQAELVAFADRFAQLERPRQAELIYRMIELSSCAASEVACNLYRLTRADEGLCIAAA